MPKSGSGRPASRRKVRGRRNPTYVPGVPGLPAHVTFRIREVNHLLFIGGGLLLGLAIGAAGWRVAGWRVALPILVVTTVSGWITSELMARDRCVEPGCGSIIPRGVRHCPGCGSAVVGVLAAGGLPEDDGG